MRRILYESPVSDFLNDDAKSEALKYSNQLYQEKKSSSPMALGTLMTYLPSIEGNNYDELLKLAIDYFLYRFPDIAADVKSGDLVLDINFIRSSADKNLLRTVSQEVPKEKVSKAVKKDKNFDTKVKNRNLNNSLSKASSWVGFNEYKNLEPLINKINPNLIKYYEQFEPSATVYYEENENFLKDSAKSSSHRAAFSDVIKNPNGNGLKFIVRAPNFPLLLHELILGGNHYNNNRFENEDEEVKDTLVALTDTHKHEIDNMKYGKYIYDTVKKIWEESVIGYQDWMESAVLNQYYILAQDEPEEYNFMMYNIIDKNSKDYYKARNLLVEYTNGFVEDIAEYYKNHPKKYDVKSKEQELTYNKLVKDGDYQYRIEVTMKQLKNIKKLFQLNKVRI